MRTNPENLCRSLASALTLFGHLFVLLLTPSAIAQSDSAVAIHFERFGQPSRIGGVAAFELSIYEDGTVVYTGHARVRVAGPVRETFERSAVQKWRQGFLDAGFMNIKAKEKFAPPADGTWHRVTLTAGATRNVVTFGDFAPANIRRALEEMLNDIDPYRKWVCTDFSRPEC
jgi:hypothetical protein